MKPMLLLGSIYSSKIKKKFEVTIRKDTYISVFYQIKLRVILDRHRTYYTESHEEILFYDTQTFRKKQKQ